MNYDSIIEETAAKLIQGKTILYPTDTIWGIGCDARNALAVQKLYNIKQRVKEKPFLILVNSIEMLKNFVSEIHPRVETLLVYHKRPLTLIYKKAKNLPPISIADDESIGIRITKDPFCMHLINHFGGPIISTSANKSGEPSPNFYPDITEDIKAEVDYIVNYRQDDMNKRELSIIASFDNKGELIIIRG